MSKIIHVTDAFNGGVFEVILELVQKFPEHDYLILYRSHSWDPTSDRDRFLRQQVKMIEWEKTYLKKYFQLRDIIINEKPHLVHLHSTLAGIIGRLIPKSKNFSLYSPHAFSFQKLDLPYLLRAILFRIEQILQYRTMANVAFWPIEVTLFKKLAPKAVIVYAPVMIEKHFQKQPKSSNRSNQKDRRASMKVASIGRLAPQKDPEFFLQVVGNLRNKLVVEAFWYGDGSQFSAKKLNDMQISKSGWLESKVIFNEISQMGCVAVFTSKWESGPITLFEALATGVPVVCRSIDAFACYGLGDGSTPEDLSKRLIEIHSKGDLSLIARDQQRTVKSNLPKSETEKLGLIYDSCD